MQINPEIRTSLWKHNVRHTHTLVSGFPESWNLDNLLRVIKRQLVCNGTIKKISDGTRVIELGGGDRRQQVVSILVSEGWCQQEQISMHDYEN